MERSDEDKDLTSGKINTTTDSGNLQDESNDAINITESIGQIENDEIIDRGVNNRAHTEINKAIFRKKFILPLKKILKAEEEKIIQQLDALEPELKITTETISNDMERSDEDKDLTSGKINTTTDSGNLQDESNDAINITESIGQIENDEIIDRGVKINKTLLKKGAHTLREKVDAATDKIIQQLDAPEPELKITTETISNDMERSDEDKDLTPSKIDTTTDSGNLQDESNDAINITESTMPTNDPIRNIIRYTFSDTISKIRKVRHKTEIDICGLCTNESDDSNEFNNYQIQSIIVSDIQRYANNNPDIPTSYFMSVVFNNGTVYDVINMYNQHKLTGVTHECSEGE